MTRSWRMFAGRSDLGSRPFRSFGDERTVRFKGDEPVPVLLVEDPDGGYYGWIDAANDGLLRREYTGAPVMVQPHEGLFRMQSPDGFAGKVARGEGEIVRMSCRLVDG